MEKSEIIEVYGSFDGWENLFTGLGVTNRDSRMSTSFNARSILQEGDLSALYSDNGLVRKIVDKHVEMMMKKPFTVDGDVDSMVRARLDEIAGWKALKLGLKWGRLFGGAIIAMGIDDGLPLEEPVNYDNIRSVDFLRTYDRFRVQVNRPADLYSEPNHPKYGEPERYTLTPLNGLPSFPIHETRCLVIDGMDATERVRLLNQGWGLSFIQHCYESLRALGEVLSNIEVITKDFITQTISMENLMELISGGQESVVKRRLELIDQSRHSLNTVLLDAMEKFEKKASTVSGLSEIADIYMVMVSAVTGMPMRVLFGKQAGGLNNEGDGETNDWYDSIESDQESIYKPVLEKLVKMIMLSDNSGFKGQELPEWFIDFPALKQMTEKEESEIRKTNSETDVNYVNAGVLEPEEVAISRFGGAEYGNDIELMTEDRESLKDDEPPLPDDMSQNNPGQNPEDVQ